MRRLLLIVLMCVLPLQWSWAAAASICEHEEELAAAAVHLGHHAHEHQAPAAQPDSEALDGKMLGDHPDCQSCHGMGTPLVGAETPLSFAWHGAMRFPPYVTVIPHRSPDTLLRPPLFARQLTG